MQYFYSPLERKCYVDVVHRNNIPSDCCEISKQQFAAIRAAFDTEQEYALTAGDKTYVVCGKPPEPTQEELTQQRIKEIQSLLTANDLASVRPLRAKLAGTATEADDARLAELEEQAQALRAELVTLNAVV